MQLTKNFNLSEFSCHDEAGTEVPSNLLLNVMLLATNLQALRDHLKEPVRINSGYRTPAYNKKIGGVKNSQHTKALAADIVVKSKTPKQLAGIIEKLIKEKKLWFGGIGLYPGFVHVDIRAKKARW